MNKAASESATGTREVEQRRALVAGIVLFASWIAGLVWLVVETSNPVTLNVAQLLNSDCVVIAELQDAETGEFTRVTMIKGEEPPEKFRVRAVSEIAAPESPRWLLALKEERDGVYSVVPVPYRDKQLLLVYPGDDEVVAQARALLGIN